MALKNCMWLKAIGLNIRSNDFVAEEIKRCCRREK
jgi:hypothetical protein